MKTIFILLTFCFFSLLGHAQWDYNHLWKGKNMLYTSGDYIVGKCNGADLGLSYAFNNKYTVKIGFSATDKASCALPDEILKSTQELTLANSTEPFQNSENLYLMVGRIINFTPDSRFRLVIQGGPGISTFREPDYIISGNEYNYKITASKELSLVLNPKLEIPLCYSLGISAGPMVVVNKVQTYVGVGIGIVYGIVKGT